MVQIKCYHPPCRRCRLRYLSRRVRQGEGFSIPLPIMLKKQGIAIVLSFVFAFVMAGNTAFAAKPVTGSIEKTVGFKGCFIQPGGIAQAPVKVDEVQHPAFRHFPTNKKSITINLSGYFTLSSQSLYTTYFLRKRSNSPAFALYIHYGSLLI